MLCWSWKFAIFGIIYNVFFRRRNLTAAGIERNFKRAIITARISNKLKNPFTAVVFKNIGWKGFSTWIFNIYFWAIWFCVWCSKIYKHISVSLSRNNKAIAWSCCCISVNFNNRIFTKSDVSFNVARSICIERIYRINIVINISAIQVHCCCVINAISGCWNILFSNSSTSHGEVSIIIYLVSISTCCISINQATRHIECPADININPTAISRCLGRWNWTTIIIISRVCPNINCPAISRKCIGSLRNWRQWKSTSYNCNYSRHQEHENELFKFLHQFSQIKFYNA